MTTAAVIPAHRAPVGGHIAGVGVVTRFLLRRDRIKLPAWVGGLGVFVIYIGTALPTIAPTPANLESLSTLFTQPVGRLFTGPAFGMDEPSYERFFATGYAPYLFVVAALMNIMLITRHTRAEEQSGRAELLRANVTGRHTSLTAALLVATITNALATVVVAAIAMGVGFAATGSLLIGVATGLVGMAFAGITAVTVQLSEYSRTAAGMAGAVLGVAFVLRALGDMVAVGGSALSWASPLGWAAQTAPYVDGRWAPLLPLVALTVITVAVAFALQHRRDFGAGLMVVKRGPAHASTFLGTRLGLAVRLQRGGLAGWGVAIVILGVVEGAFAQALVDAGVNMPAKLREVVGTGSDLAVGYLSFLGTFVGVLIVAYTVSATQVLRTEESRGRTEAILATATSRVSYLGTHVAVAAAGALIIAAFAGLGTGIAAALATGQASMIGDGLLAHLGPVPAIWLLLAVGMALIGWVPRLAVPVGWVLVVISAVTSFFGELLSLPGYVMALSPFEHLPRLPQESFAPTPFVTLIVLAVAITALGLAGIRRRQINTV